MDLNLIDTSDFKDQFPRGFPYLPVYDDEQIYNKNDEVFYNGLFYTCKLNGVVGVTPIEPSEEWALYADDIDAYISDADINRAFAEAKIGFNQALAGGNDDTIKLLYLYLTAHYLVHDIRAALQGLNGQAGLLLASRSAGSISESYAIPEVYTKSPMLAFLTTSMYGIKYLNLIYPRMIGNFMVIKGGTVS